MKKIASLILENKKGEILLYQRDNKSTIPYPLHWDLFGGYVEESETPEEALIREVKEELDYDLKEYRFYKKYKSLTVEAYPNVKYVYVGKVDKPIEELTLQEGRQMRFFSREEIPQVKFANILKQIVMDYIADEDFKNIT